MVSVIITSMFKRALVFALCCGMLFTGSAIAEDHPELDPSQAAFQYQRTINAGFWIHKLATSPDGKFVAASGESEKVSIWNIDDGTNIRNIETKQHDVFAIDYSPDGTMLATAGHTGRIASICVWDLSTGSKLFSFEGIKNPIESIKFSPDGKYLAAVRLDSAFFVNTQIFVWSLATRTLTKTFSFSRIRSMSVDFSAAGDKIYSCVNHGFGEIDIASGTESVLYKDDDFFCTQFNGHASAGLFTFSGVNIHHTVEYDGPSGALTLRRENDGQWKLLFFTYKIHSYAADISPDQKWVAIVGPKFGFRGIVKIFDVHSGNMATSIKHISGFAYDVRFSNSGDHLLVGTSNGNIYIWGVKSIAEEQPLKIK